ncbi:hypothetical protein Gasu2_59600 [Galdieria sulphuraria]|nr:hypothetical protein Gasu2_59600 [Galdieria sulphuraria]
MFPLLSELYLMLFASSLVALVTVSFGNLSSTSRFCLGFKNPLYCIFIATYSALASLTTLALLLKCLCLQVLRTSFLETIAESRRTFLFELVLVVFLFVFDGAVSIAVLLGEAGLDYCSPLVFGYSSRACETARTALIAIWVSLVLYVILCSVLLTKLRNMKANIH